MCIRDSSYSAGAPGGLFSPLLLVGASFGALFGETFSALFGEALHPLPPDLIPSTPALAVVGMAAFFTAVVRAPLTGLILIMETVSYTHLVCALITGSTKVIWPLRG